MRKTINDAEKPRGTPIERPWLDKEDKPILDELGQQMRCTQRLLVDHGHHYIFCGAYHPKLPTVMTEKGPRCIFHR